MADAPNWGMTRTTTTTNATRFIERTLILHAKNIWTLLEINPCGMKRISHDPNGCMVVC